MQVTDSATIKQWRQSLIEIRGILALDGRTKKAKRWRAQRQLLLAMASDAELEQMARMGADMFDYPYEEFLKDLRNNRELHRENVQLWRGHLAKLQK